MTRTEPAPAPGGPAGAKRKASVRAAAAHFYDLYFARQFAATWALLAPAAKNQIPEDIWIGVHNGCPPARPAKARVIEFVTVFGNAAIVTERLAGVRARSGRAEDVFNYVNGRWGYSPSVLSIYHHGSVAADVAAARADGFCSSRRVAPL